MVVTIRRWNPGINVTGLVKLIRSINEEPFLFLAKTPELAILNKALLYVRDNEQTSRVLVVSLVLRLMYTVAADDGCRFVELRVLYNITSRRHQVPTPTTLN